MKQRATQAFIENNLQQTRERTGVLIFVSLLERRIEVLADTGIDSQAPENFWDEVVAELGQSIRQGQLAQGLTQAIKRCGDLLETQAPARSDDRNELPDRVIVEK
ncbi:MAG: TPM domain-containing protein [Myxococcota bacterium]